MAKKRGNGEGSIYRRKDGRWVGQYTVSTARGREYRYIYGKTRKAVAAKLTKAIADRDGGIVLDNENLNLEQYLERWLENSVCGTVRPTTYESYRWLLYTHLVPSLGHVKLRDLTSDRVQRFYRSKLDDGLAPRTVRYLHTLLNKAIKQAVAWNLVTRNVAEVVKPPRLVKTEFTTFTLD